ncbi:MAG TPA: response regulator [Candidatus Methylomirabilis sp.]|nr:response regulator [Candidatus Methylomirabilis sp.]
MTSVIAVVNDLFFWTKILETAERLNVPLRLVRSPEELEAQVRACRPALLIFDLNAETCQPLQAIRRMKADPELKDIPALGFFSHVQHDLKAAATEAGCDRIMARSGFTAQLPKILRPYATP